MILIDNGHGYNTAGKRSPIWADGTQLLEWQFNRKVARELSAQLFDRNIPNCLVVPEDYDIPLNHRIERINMLCKKYDDCRLISIHANAGGGTGWEIFTSKGETQSDAWATQFIHHADRLLPFPVRKDYTDGDPDKEASFYLLKHSHCPAVLTENLFMDREEDCRYLMSEEGVRKVVEVHLGGVGEIRLL